MTATAQAPAPGTEVGTSGKRRPWVIAVALAGGLLFDLAVKTPLDGAAALALVAVVAVALVTAGGVRTLAGRALVLASLIPATCLVLRASPWLVWLDLAAVVLLVLTGVAFGRGGDPFDAGFTDLAARTLRSAGRAILGPAELVREVQACVPATSAGRRRQAAAIARGVLLAAPFVAAITFALASGDAVFASLLDLSVDVPSLYARTLLVALGMVLAVGAIAAAGPIPATTQQRRLRLGALESCAVLGGLVLVYGLYAWSQLLVARGGTDYVQSTTGLTMAEYARSGFFNLLWAAGITLVALLGVHGLTTFESRASIRTFRALSAVAVALTLVVVHGAIVRLGHYESEFGLTMLRLYSTAFAWWIGAVFVVAGLALIGVNSSRRWLAGAVLTSALVALVAMNVVDPERLVVERNLERARSGDAAEPFDLHHAASLSDDAVPALLDGLASLPGDTAPLYAEACGLIQPKERDEWNLPTRRARDAIERHCGSSTR